MQTTHSVTEPRDKPCATNTDPNTFCQSSEFSEEFPVQQTAILILV